MGLTISTESSSHHSVTLTLDGQLNSDTAAEFERTVQKVVTDTLVTLVLDMKKLTFISSAGIGVIMKIKTTLNRHGRHMAMIYMPPAVERVFEMTHLLGMMRTFVSEAQLDDYLAAVQDEINQGD